jgi:hypothetical protein
MTTERKFSFADVVQGKNAFVRVTSDDFIWAVDLSVAIMMNGHERDYAAQALRDIPDNIFPSRKFIFRKMPGSGNGKTKLLSFHDAIELIMVFPGKTAKHIRKQFADIIVRYLDGDRTMCIEVEENKAMGKIKSYSKFARHVTKKIVDDKANQFQEIPQTCYVYATKSTAFPGLIKIGKTDNVTRRVSQLNTACAPAPHVIVAAAPTFDKDRDEKTAHAFFSKTRRAGEFFEITDAEVMAYFTMHITSQYNTELTQNISSLQGMHV